MEEPKVITDTVLEVQNGFIDINLIYKRIEDHLKKKVFKREEMDDGKVSS